MIKLLVDHPIVLVFAILAAGSAIGAVKVRGVALGPAGALFAGLALSAIDDRLAIPEVIGTLGLAVFTYTIGLSSGPVFFAAVRSEVRTIATVVGVLLVGAAASFAAARLLGFDNGLAAGLFAGSLTNTPALAAAQEALHGSAQPVIGYSVAYPIGVIGMIGAAALALRAGRRAPNDDDRRARVDLVTLTIRVRHGVSVALATIGEHFGGAVVFSRVERNGAQQVPDAGFIVRPGDLLSLTSPVLVSAEVVHLLGDPVPTKLSDDRSRLDMRRIVVSDRHVIGHRLGDLDLHARFGAVATRVRRGDVDLLARDDTTLLPGDRLRVVAPRDRLAEVTKFLGDSERRVAEVDALGFMVGIAVGLAFGLIKVPLLGDAHFSLGNAGGPLVVGLILGRLERTGPLTWQPPYGANLALRQLGTILFLGMVGSHAGGALVDALSSPRGVKLAVAAASVVALAAVAMLAIGRRALGLGGARLAGTLAGMQTQPAVLAFATEQSADDRVSTSYALVFPVAMLVKIVLAQVLVLI